MLRRAGPPNRCRRFFRLRGRDAASPANRSSLALPCGKKAAPRRKRFVPERGVGPARCPAIRRLAGVAGSIARPDTAGWPTGRRQAAAAAATIGRQSSARSERSLRLCVADGAFARFAMIVARQHRAAACVTQGHAGLRSRGSRQEAKMGSAPAGHRNARLAGPGCGAGAHPVKRAPAVALEQQNAEFVRLRGNQPLSREFALSE
ncbi:MAG: hypothetical protein JWN66_2862 [Sphingomonas bacterium]|nr:hypothetical protein [Sphingomonas bacterium]